MVPRRTVTDTANLRLSPPGAPPSPAPSCRPRRKWVARLWPGFCIQRGAPALLSLTGILFLSCPLLPSTTPLGGPSGQPAGPPPACVDLPSLSSSIGLLWSACPSVQPVACSFFFSRNPAASPLALETALGGCGPCVFPTAAVTSTTRWFRQTDRRLFSYSSGGEKPAVHLVGLTSRCRRAGPSGGSRGGSPHCCFQPPVAASIPWLAAASLESLPPWECGLFLWSSFPPPLFYSLQKVIRHIGLQGLGLISWRGRGEVITQPITVD